jgi:hypothetical protein
MRWFDDRVAGSRQPDFSNGVCLQIVGLQSLLEQIPGTNQRRVIGLPSRQAADESRRGKHGVDASVVTAYFAMPIGPPWN